MRLTRTVQEILSWYESDNPGTKTSLARILMEGKLGGTGKLVILPVDQGFEHGPARSFSVNPAAYDPHYHFQLAIDAGLSVAVVSSSANAKQVLRTAGILERALSRAEAVSGPSAARPPAAGLTVGRYANRGTA